jgi:hypothetical protein
VTATTQGSTVIPEELSAFAAVALAGLGDLPDTIMSRSIVIRMRRRAPNETVLRFRRREHEQEGRQLHDRLVAWAAAVASRITVPDMPSAIVDRAADCWEPLLAVADAAGEHWPDTARVSAVSFVLASGEEARQSDGARLLSDLYKIFGGNGTKTDDEFKTTAAILTALTDADESPWKDVKGKPLSDVGLSNRLRPYGIKPETHRIGDNTPRGYWRSAFADAWRRYLPPPVEVQNSRNNETEHHDS